MHGHEAGADVADAMADTSSDTGVGDASGPCGRFKTGFTGSWGTAASVSITPSWMSGYVPATGTATFYIGDSMSTFQSYDRMTDTYTTLLAPDEPTLYGLAWTTGFSTGMAGFNQADYLEIYNVTTGTWTAPGMTLAGSEQAGATATDDAGNVWGFQNSSGLLKWPGFGVVTLPTPLASPVGLMTFDSCSGLLYVTSVNGAALYSFDPTSNSQTLLTGLPSGRSFGNAFCGDRSGHIFAFPYEPSTPFYQYTIATDSWTALPSGATNGGENLCAVGADGYLYTIAAGVSTTMNRIKLK
jgi:hypothetical protein